VDTQGFSEPLVSLGIAGTWLNYGWPYPTDPKWPAFPALCARELKALYEAVADLPQLTRREAAREGGYTMQAHHISILSE
jgi:hypothetical protein